MAELEKTDKPTQEFIGQNYATLTPERIREYHKKGADLNALWRDGSTLLQKLCHLGQEDIEHLGLTDSIRTLVECGADPNVKDHAGWGTLDYVFDSGKEGIEDKLKLLAPHLNQETLKTLKETNPDAAKLVEEYKTAPTDTVLPEEKTAENEALTQPDAIPTEEPKKEETPLSEAEAKESKKGERKMTPEEATEKLKNLRWSVINADAIKECIAAGADTNVLNDNGHTLLTTLCGSPDENDIELVKEVLENGANPDLVNQYGFSPLHYALTSHSFESLKLLAEHKADFLTTAKKDFEEYLKENKEALDFVTETVKKQRQEKGLPEEEEKVVTPEVAPTPTEEAESETSEEPAPATPEMTPEQANEKLKAMKNNWTDENPMTQEEWQQIKALLEKGADVNTVLLPDENLTLAHVAAGYGSKENMQMLDEKGIDWKKVYSPDEIGQTAAHLAVLYNKDDEAVKFLIGKVDFNTPDKEKGKSALDYIEVAEKKAQVEDWIRQAKEAADSPAPSETEHGVDPTDNGEEDEGDAHPINPNDKGEEDEGDVEIPTNTEENETDTRDKGAETPENGAEPKKPTEWRQAEKVSKALVDATNTFFKNVFEGNHKTAEDFSQALLFNLLAFPLEALGNYLSQEDKKKLDELAKKIDDKAKGQQQSEEEKRLGNIVKLQYLMMKRDPEAFKQLYEGLGKQEGITADEVDTFLKSNPELQKRMEKNLGEIAGDPEGRAIIEGIFPDNYNGAVSKEDLISVLTGRLDSGKTPEKEKEEKAEKNDSVSKKELLDFIKVTIPEAIKAANGQKVIVNNNLRNIGNPVIRDVGKVTQENVGNASVKGSGNSKATGGSTGAIDVKGASAKTGEVKVAGATVKGATVDGVSISGATATGGAGGTGGAANADSHAQQTQTGAAATTGAMSQTANPSVNPTITVSPTQTAQGGAGGNASVSDAAKIGSMRQSQDDNSSRGDSIKTDKSIKVDGADNVVRQGAESKKAPKPVMPPKAEQKKVEEKGDLPFTLPSKMSEQNKAKIMSFYEQLQGAKGADKKVALLAEFIRSKESTLKQKADALDLIQNHKKILDGLLDKNGRFNQSLLNKTNKGLGKNKQLNAETAKLALGLRKRLTEGSKAGATQTKQNQGR